MSLLGPVVDLELVQRETKPKAQGPFWPHGPDSLGLGDRLVGPRLSLDEQDWDGKPSLEVSKCILKLSKCHVSPSLRHSR